MANSPSNFALVDPDSANIFIDDDDSKCLLSIYLVTKCNFCVCVCVSVFVFSTSSWIGAIELSGSRA